MFSHLWELPAYVIAGNQSSTNYYFYALSIHTEDVYVIHAMKHVNLQFKQAIIIEFKDVWLVFYTHSFELYVIQACMQKDIVLHSEEDIYSIF